MKVIFLDFDGVIVVRPGDLRSPNRERVALLNEIVARTGAEVVVSSTWRLGRTVDELRDVLCCAGFEGVVLGSTPRLPERVERGWEIQAWLHHRFGRDLMRADYVVLDDDSDRGPIPEWRWILCLDEPGDVPLTRGLRPEHVETACRVLLRQQAEGRP